MSKQGYNSTSNNTAGHLYADTAGPHRAGPDSPEPSRLKASSLGAIIGQIKSACTGRIWADGHTDFAWQERFFDRIIRTEAALRRIRKYIVDNPIRWERDRLNPRRRPAVDPGMR